MTAAQPRQTPKPAPSEADWERLAHVLAVAVAEANGWRPAPTGPSCPAVPA